MKPGLEIFIRPEIAHYLLDVEPFLIYIYNKRNFNLESPLHLNCSSSLYQSK